MRFYWGTKAQCESDDTGAVKSGSLADLKKEFILQPETEQFLLSTESILNPVNIYSDGITYQIMRTV